MAEPAAKRILFVTSNGTGLGHLTRSMAIARALGDEFEPMIFTLSAAAGVVREQGFPVEYCASYRTPCAGTEWRWSRRLRGRVEAAIEEARPAAIVFDGAHPYLGFLDALRSSAQTIPKIWCRRAMWKPGANWAALPRTGAFDAVLEPGDIAASEDRGPTVERRYAAKLVGPIVYVRPEELLRRGEAEAQLGLAPGRTNVLVQLGQGPEVQEAAERCIRMLTARNGVQVAVLSSAIAREHDTSGQVVALDATYPIARYFGAFDMAIAAAGYNAFHELLTMRVPSLFVPMPRDTDDQAARARFAEREGIGRGLETPDSDDLERVLDELLDPEQRDQLSLKLADLSFEDGASQAADWLAQVVNGSGRVIEAAAAHRRNWHMPGGSPREALEFAARVPSGVAALSKQVVTAPKPPRTVVVALGIEPRELGRGVTAAISSTGDPPERVLVITDSLDFKQLQRLGVGFEHVPARGELQAELAGGHYDSFLRRRLSLILAERRRPQRFLAIGEAGEAAIASLNR